jgi:GDP-D-mannose dehydratase
MGRRSQMKNKKALISGCNGQDGSYLSELLLEKEYKVYGLLRRSSVNTTERIDHLLDNPNFELVEGDITDASCMHRLISGIKPDEVYNLAAMSHVGMSFDQPVTTCQINAVGPLNILEAIRQSSPQSKFYQASCHDTETLLVTPRGLKRYDEITEEDMVYTINETTGLFELKSIDRVLIHDFDGDMISLCGRRIDSLITPNHRILLQKDDGDIVGVIADCLPELYPYERTSEYSTPMSRHVGEDIDIIDLHDYVEQPYNSHNYWRNYIWEFDANDLLYLFGIYLGDGYVKKGSKYKRKMTKSARMLVRDDKGCFSDCEYMDEEDIEASGSYICICVPDTDPARKNILTALNRMGIDYKLDNMNIKFSSYPLAQFFKLCGKNVYDKKIPRFIFDYSTELLRSLFNGLIDSDGYRKNDIPKSYVTVSENLLCSMIELCYRIGVRCSFITHAPGSQVSTLKDGRTITNTVNSYALNFSDKGTNKIYKYHYNKQQYHGKVWCLSVKDNHNFLVSRHGKLCFSGNSSELFGDTKIAPQSESTPMTPNSPYAVSKLYAHHLVGLYRRAYGIFACAGILFNHESPRRGETFVTRKITKYVAKTFVAIERNNGILPDNWPKLFLGNLEARRDWGFAGNYVEAMWLMLQQDKPVDYVIASNESHTVCEFLALAFCHVGLDYRDFVEIDPKFFRPAEVNYLCGDSSKARRELGWFPKVLFKELVCNMVDSDKLLIKEKHSRKY